MKSIKQFDIWIADLNPQRGTEPGKSRPVVIVQTNLLNKTAHPSTLICPLTTRVNTASEILRVHLPKGQTGLTEACDILIDQIRAIDNRRLTKCIGPIPEEFIPKIKENIQIVLGLE